MVVPPLPPLAAPLVMYCLVFSRPPSYTAPLTDCALTSTPSGPSSLQIRNIAIIAHVDHGKTTLVDQMLRQAGVFRANQQVNERVMDSNPLERERGITILSKNTAVHWGDTKINIVDTPGHADFGGEVERILRMVDGFLLLVDAAEGPMPQTKFVAGKALALGLKPIVLVNKIDRQDAEPLRVHDEVLELFLDLEATPEQFNCPFLYTSSRAGTATLDLKAPGTDLNPLFQTILDTIPAPKADPNGPFQMLVSTLDYSSYLGRIAIGRIERGRVKVGETVALLPLGEPGPLGDAPYEQAKVVKLFSFDGLERVEVQDASAGDIVALAGLVGVEIGKTVTAPDYLERLTGIAVEEPTISVDFKVNDSPFAGREGKFVTGRQLRDRLFRELEKNVALRGEETDDPQTFTVSGPGGRGGWVRALQLAGARDDVRQTGGSGVRGHGRGRERASGGHGREPLQGKETHEHADDGVGRDDHPGAAASGDAGAGARVHRGRRADRGHAVVHPAAQARARGHGASQAGAERAIG